jgi:hypothetical protein
MGFFTGLNDEKYDRQYSDRELLRRIFGYFKPQTRRMTWIVVLVVILAVIGAALPVVVARMVDLLEGQASLKPSPGQPGGAAPRCWIVGIELGPAQPRGTGGG